MLDSAGGRPSPRAEWFLCPRRSCAGSRSAPLWESGEKDTADEATGQLNVVEDLQQVGPDTFVKCSSGAIRSYASQWRSVHRGPGVQTGMRRRATPLESAPLLLFLV